MNTFQLRKWQSDVHTMIFSRHYSGEYLQNSKFLCVAGVGSGKTSMAVTAFQRLQKLDFYDNAIFVSPQRSVRNGFIETGGRFGMQFTHIVDSHSRELYYEYDGLSITYAGLDSLEILKDLITKRTLIVLDEPHHLSLNENKGTISGWAHRAETLLNQAGYIILMTGTPFRTNEDEKILFAEYEEVVPGIEVLKYDYYYSYGQSVRDGITAECKFEFCYGSGAYKHKGKEYKFNLNRLSDKADEPKILKTLLEPDTDFAKGMINQAVRKLHEIRTPQNNYAGLIVCRDKHHAGQVSNYLFEQYGIVASLIIDDEGDSLQEIEDFKTSTRKFAVAVRQVSEGTDIPRLKVCCYLSNWRTLTFFVQVFGRIVRQTMPGVKEYAYMFIPAIDSFKRHVALVEKDITDTFTQREIGTGAAPPERNPSDFEILQTSFAGEVDFDIREITAEPVEIKAYKVVKLRRNISKLTAMYAEMYRRRRQKPMSEIGDIIAKVHRKVNEKVGAEKQENMTLNQLNMKARILVEAIEREKG